MKRYLLIMFIVLALLVGACSTRERSKVLGADAVPEDIGELTGTYVVNGFDPTGIEYGGHLTVTAGNQPGSYQMQWVLAGSILAGTATLDGNQLLIDWVSVDQRETPSQGTALYTITVDGELYGERFVEGYDNPGTEEAFPNQ